MAKIRTQKIWQAISCLLCVIVAWGHLDDVGASEFIGGWLTGPLFEMADYGIVFFLVALLLTFFSRRVASIMTLSGSVLCMPFYSYFLAPGPFRSVFRGEYSVPLRAPFVWNTWAVFGILSLVFAIVTSLRCLVTADPVSIPKPEHGEAA
jgi:hypothetical protein